MYAYVFIYKKKFKLQITRRKKKKKHRKSQHLPMKCIAYIYNRYNNINMHLRLYVFVNKLWKTLLRCVCMSWVQWLTQFSYSVVQRELLYREKSSAREKVSERETEKERKRKEAACLKRYMCETQFFYVEKKQLFVFFFCLYFVSLGFF